MEVTMIPVVIGMVGTILNRLERGSDGNQKKFKHIDLSIVEITQRIFWRTCLGETIKDNYAISG